MPPVAVPIKFGAKLQHHHHHKDLRHASYTIVGDIKDPRFHQACIIAQSAANKHGNIVKIEMRGIDPFQYKKYLIETKQKHQHLVDKLYEGCLIEVDGNKIMPLNDFAKTASEKYDVNESRPAALYSAMGKTAFEDYLTKLKGEVIAFDVQIDGKPSGAITIQLRSDICPKTVAHFMKFVGEGSPGPHDTNLSYNGCKMGRLLHNGWVQTGEIILPQGTIFKEDPLPDENFIIKHDRRGVVSMVNTGPHTNYSAFMIVFKPMPYFDRKYVAIGYVLDGEETLAKIEAVPTRFERPEVDIVITNTRRICGLGPDPDEQS